MPLRLLLLLLLLLLLPREWKEEKSYRDQSLPLSLSVLYLRSTWIYASSLSHDR